MAFGPPLGGWLVDHAGWRTIFLINVPIAALALALSLKTKMHKPKTVRHGLDYPGAALAVLTLGLLIFGLIELGEGALVAGAISVFLAIPAGTLFIWTEARTKVALMPLRLFRKRDFAGANALTVVLYGGLSGALFLLPFVLIRVHHFSPIAAGTAFVPLSVILGLGSRFAGGLATRTGARFPLIVGPLVTAVGFATLGFSGGSPSYSAGFLPGLVLIAVGMTLAVPALTTTVFDAAPDADSGAASGINNAAARTGGLLAVAALGIAFGSSNLSSLGAPALMSAYRAVMLSAAAAGVLSAVCAAMTISADQTSASA